MNSGLCFGGPYCGEMQRSSYEVLRLAPVAPAEVGVDELCDGGLFAGYSRSHQRQFVLIPPLPEVFPANEGKQVQYRWNGRWQRWDWDGPERPV